VERLCRAGLAVESAGALLLTARGRRELSARLAEWAAPPRPRWDAAARTLWWEGRVAKRLLRGAPAQEAVLAAFEGAGWPGRIDDPLEPDPEADPKGRLRETVKSLNARLKAGTIRFHADGTGRGVLWKRVPRKRAKPPLDP
jgi:hypothetical protein